MANNIYFNLGDVEFIGGVKVKDLTYTLDEFRDILNSSKSIVANASDVLEWSKEVSYKKNNIVTYKGSIYVSLTDNNLNYSPNINIGSQWKLYGVNTDIENYVNTLNGLSNDVSILEGPGINISKVGNSLMISNTSVGKTLDIQISKNDYTSTNYSYKWTDNVCEIQHNLGGRVFAQIYDENNCGSLLVANYVSDNVVNVVFTDILKQRLNNSPNLYYHLLLGVNKGVDTSSETITDGIIITDTDITVGTSKTLTVSGQIQTNIITPSLTLNSCPVNTPGGLVVVGAGNKLPALDGSLLTNLPNTSNVIPGECLTGNGTENNPLTVVVGSGIKKDDGISLDISNYLSTDPIIFNYNNDSYLSIKAGGLTLFSTDKINLNTNDLRLNNKALNTANGLLQLGSDGKIDQSYIKFDQSTTELINWGASGNAEQLSKLTNLINSYDYFMSYIANNFEVKEIYCTMALTTQGGNITKDTTNKDNDVDTVYLYEVTGYVLGVESYVTNQDTQMKRFFPDISYDKSEGEYGTSYIYFSEVEFETIRELNSPKNKVKIQYVQLKTKQ